MSIKTNELQKLTSVLGTDSVLMDTDAKGTVRLPLTDLAKFLTEQDNAVKAALSSKAALSAQQTLEKTSVPTRTETVAAANLPAFIAALPRLMTEALTINVTGELTERLTLSNFCGPGRIAIQGSGNFSMRNMISVNYCAVNIVLSGIKFYEISGMTHTQGSVLVNRTPSYVHLSGCQFQGLGTASATMGVHAQYGANVQLDNCSVSGYRYAILSNLCSIVSVADSTFSDNTYGVNVSNGGIIARGSTSIPELFGGKANAKYGGIVIDPDGTI